MHVQPSRETLITLTKLSPFDRFENGRPRVPDALLERMKLVTTEEAWAVLRKHGYHRQFEGNWRETHPGKSACRSCCHRPIFAPSPRLS